MTRLLMSSVAVAALVAFGSMADAQQAQQPVQTMPNQGAGSGSDTGAGGAAGAGAQTQDGAAGRAPDADARECAARNGAAEELRQYGEELEHQEKELGHHAEAVRGDQGRRQDQEAEPERRGVRAAPLVRPARRARSTSRRASGRRSPSPSPRTRSSPSTSMSMCQSAWLSRGPWCSIRFRSTSSRSFRHSGTTGISCWPMARSSSSIRRPSSWSM